MAALCLVARGRYPSGRAILNELGRTGRTKGKKLNLNGRECNWKAWVFELCNIEPCVIYTPLHRREDWITVLAAAGPFKLRRGPRGTLIETSPSIGPGWF